MKQQLLIRKLNMVTDWRQIVDLVEGAWNFNVVSKLKPLYPREMLVNLTYCCNSRCTMCHIWQMKPEKEMDLVDWKKAVKDPIFKEVRGLTVSGGEPMLHSEFNEIIDLFIKKLPKIKELGLVTNGFLTEAIIKKVKLLAKMCVDNDVKLSVSVSLDGVGEIHGTVRGVKDAFKKTEATILILKKLRQEMDNSFNLNVGSVILKQNLDYFEETRNWLQKMEIDHGFQIVGFHETFVNNLGTKEEVGFSEKDKKKLLIVLEKLKKDEWMKSYYWNDLKDMYTKGLPRTTPCPFVVDQMVIDGTGEVFYCLSEKSIGNFLREKRSIADIYFDKNNLKIRKERWQTVCRKCNSGCNAKGAIAYDVKKYLWYKITGKAWLR